MSPKLKKQGDTDTLNALGARLVYVLHAQVRHVRSARRGSVAGCFACVVQTQIVRQVRTNNVGLMHQRILRAYGRKILVCQQIWGIQDGSAVEIRRVIATAVDELLVLRSRVPW